MSPPPLLFSQRTESREFFSNRKVLDGIYWTHRQRRVHSSFAKAKCQQTRESQWHFVFRIRELRNVKFVNWLEIVYPLDRESKYLGDFSEERSSRWPRWFSDSLPGGIIAAIMKGEEKSIVRCRYSRSKRKTKLRRRSLNVQSVENSARQITAKWRCSGSGWERGFYPTAIFTIRVISVSRCTTKGENGESLLSEKIFPLVRVLQGTSCIGHWRRVHGSLVSCSPAKRREKGAAYSRNYAKCENLFHRLATGSTLHAELAAFFAAVFFFLDKFIVVVAKDSRIWKLNCLKRGTENVAKLYVGYVWNVDCRKSFRKMFLLLKSWWE